MASPQKAQTLAERLTFIAKVFEAKESSLAKEFHALSEEAGELEREKTDWFMQADTLNEQLEAAESRVAVLTEVLRYVLDEWFEPHYGTNDVGMAALIRDRLRAALAERKS